MRTSMKKFTVQIIKLKPCLFSYVPHFLLHNRQEVRKILARAHINFKQLNLSQKEKHITLEKNCEKPGSRRHCAGW